MGRRPKIPSEIKIEYAEKILAGKATVKGTARELGLHPKSVQEWMAKYRAKGASGLLERHSNNHYSRELKLAAVQDYLGGKGSQLGLCAKYGIASPHVLKTWIEAYNAHKELKPTGGGSRMSRKESRKTTYEERVEIVRYCLNHGSDYGETALKYDVTYQNVYQWVAKYRELGNPGLEDRRGKRRGSLPARSPEEELRNRIAQLEAKNHMLKMENDLLKKWKSCRGRDAFADTAALRIQGDEGT